MRKIKKLLKLFSKKETKTFKVAGVTFKNGRKSRQTILRKIRWGDDEFEDASIIVTLDKEEFEGEPALAVLVNGQKIGHVPANLVKWCLDNHITFIGGLKVYGGGRTEEGERINFGAEITVVVKKAQ